MEIALLRALDLKDLCITRSQHEMRAAPAEGQAGAARCCHRAKCFGLAAGLCRGLS